MRSGWDPLFFLPKPESPVGPNVINKSCERVRLALMSGEPAPLSQVCTESPSGSIATARQPSEELGVYAPPGHSSYSTDAG